MKHILKVLESLVLSIAPQPIIQGSEVTNLSGYFAQIVPKCLQKKLLRVVPLAIAIIIPLNSFPALACRQTVKQNVTGNMNNADLAIIADIKRAYIALVLNSTNPSKIAAEFGTVTNISPENDQKVKPFNPDLQLVRVTTSGSAPSYVAHTVELIPKPQTPVSIAALQREFGDYIEVPTLHPNGTFMIAFILYPTEIKPKNTTVVVRYKYTPKGINFARIVNISIMI